MEVGSRCLRTGLLRLVSDAVDLNSDNGGRVSVEGNERAVVARTCILLLCCDNKETEFSRSRPWLRHLFSGKRTVRPVVSFWISWPFLLSPRLRGVSNRDLD